MAKPCALSVGILVLVVASVASAQDVPQLVLVFLEPNVQTAEIGQT